MPQPVYNYADVGTGGFDPNDPSVMGRVTKDTNAASTNEVNIWMRGQPWYQAIIAQHGGSAGSDAAKSQIIAAAQKNGVQIDQSNVDVDDSGNLQVKGMSGWEKGLIIAGVAAATIATMGAAGVFDAAAAAGAEGAGDAAAIDAGAAAAGEAGLTTGAAGAAGALGDLGAAGGIGVEGAGSTLGAIGAGTGAVLPSTAVGTGMVGATSLPAGTALAGTGGLAGTDAAAGGLGSLGNTSTLGQVAGALGKGIGAATTAAGNNQLNQEQLGLQANQQNINASGANTASKNSAIADLYRAGLAENHTATSPYATNGAPTYSPAYMQAQSDLENAALARLGPDQTGAIAQIPINNVQGATGTTPSTLQNISQYAGPVLSTIGTIAGYFK